MVLGSHVLSSRATAQNVSPMTGVVLWSDNEKAASEAIQLEYSYVGYDEVAISSAQYDWTRVEELLDAAASRKHQMILRFYFTYVGKKSTVPGFIQDSPGYKKTVGKSEGKTTEFCDWSSESLQSFTLDFYRRFAERYDRDPRLAFLQVGFGLWAEYHIYDGPNKLGETFPSKSFQERFLGHMNDVFAETQWMISIDAADDTYSPFQSNPELISLGFGLFDDSFLCKPHPKENALNWRFFGSDRWKNNVAGGEFSYYNRRDQKLALSEDGPNGVSVEAACRQFHISFMIGNDQPRYQSSERIAEVGRAMGYRFAIVDRTIVDGQTMVKVANRGVAPIYYDAYLAIGDTKGRKSLRGLLPGESAAYSITTQSDAPITVHCKRLVAGQTIPIEN